MDQETRWLMRYNEVKSFIETNHRNPSKHKIEEHDMLNWVKQQRIDGNQPCGWFSALMGGGEDRKRSLHVGRDDKGRERG